MLFDFGEGGVAIVAILMLIAFWRLQRYPVMAAILLPFLIASLLNSAEGSFEYAFVVLGIMLFTFHWVDTPMAISSYAETRGSAYPSLTPNSD